MHSQVTRFVVLVAIAAVAVGVVAWAQSPPRHIQSDHRRKRGFRGLRSAESPGTRHARPSPRGYRLAYRRGSSTTFTTGADITVSGTAIAKGAYSLFTKRVSEDTWHLVFNSQTGQWGTSHDASRDVGEAQLTWKKDGDATEQCTIEPVRLRQQRRDQADVGDQRPERSDRVQLAAFSTGIRRRRCPFHKLELYEIGELPATRMLWSSSYRTF